MARTGISFVVFVWICVIIRMDVTITDAGNDVNTVNTVNTENLSTPVNEQEIVEQPDVDFTAGPFVTRHNPTGEGAINWRFSTAWYGSLLGVFHWVLYLLPGIFLVPPRPGFQAIHTVTKT